MKSRSAKSRKVRVFISSTFRDMNAERDHLVRYVFPRVAMFCKERNLEFIPIDLRWGITEEESRNGLVVNACLDEVDNSRPFFIGFLGFRYGWTPGEHELEHLSPALIPERDWLKSRVKHGASITEIEIEYAVLRDMNLPHACFFIRSDSENIPDEFRERSDSEAAGKLSKLKARIRKQTKYPVYDYTDLTSMGDILYRDLIAMIESEYPTDTDSTTDALISPHEISLLNRAKTLCDISSTTADFHRWLNEGARVFLIKSRPGGGSSTVLAYNILLLRETMPDIKIIYFDFESVTGSYPGEELQKFLALPENQMDEGRPDILAIDNISILEGHEITDIINIIDNLPEASRIVLSVRDSSDSDAEVLLTFRYQPPSSTLHGYVAQQRRDFVINYAAEYGKRLTSQQIETIVSSKASSDSTWLKMVVEAVVTHGVFETLNERITELSKRDDLNFLFWEILINYEQAYKNAGLLRDFIYATIAISLMPEGLPEKDIMEAFNIAQAHWSAIRPGLLRFCRGNADRISLRNYDWNQTVKNHWSTNLRAYVGKRLSDWYLADDDRRKRGARTVASIYSDIWHLPFDYDDNEEQNFESYKDSIARFALSRDAVTSLSPQLFRIVWQPNIGKTDIHVLIGRALGQPVASLDYKTKIDYLTRMGEFLSCSGKPALAAECYQTIGRNSPEGSAEFHINSAKALLECGKAKNALNVLNNSALLSDSIPAMILRNRAYQILGRYDDLFLDTANLLNSIDSFDISDGQEQFSETFRLLSAMFSQVTSSILSMSMVYDENVLNEFINLYNSIGDFIRKFGLMTPAGYNYSMFLALIGLFTNDMNILHINSYHAIKSAFALYGKGWQYGRAANLFAVAVYRIHGQYMNWHNSPYIQNRYHPLDHTRSYPGIDESEPDKEVISAIRREEDFFERIIASIQPENNK